MGAGAGDDESEGRYLVSSTSRQSARVEPQVLSLRREDDGSLTRRIIEPLIVENPGTPEASVKIAITHQRRRTAGGPWENEAAFNLATMRADEQIRLALSSEETLALFQHLERLYRVGEQGVLRGEHLVTVVDEREAAIIRGSAKEILEKLVQTNGAELFEILDAIEPDLLTAAAVARTHAVRSEALETFERQMQGEWAETEWTEPDWQRFFEANPWIFGHGLDYRFLVTAQAQPHYGGASVEGVGGERGDFLMNTEGDARFAVLVEIKRPDRALVGDRRYRNGAWHLSDDLTGGVAQIQANCHHWAVEGSQSRRNREWLEERGIAVVEPSGILLIGDTATLGDDTDKLETFERYRRNLHNPEVITYDELLARARFLVEQSTPGEPEPPQPRPRPRPQSAPNEDFVDVEDIPF